LGWRQSSASPRTPVERALTSAVTSRSRTRIRRHSPGHATAGDELRREQRVTKALLALGQRLAAITDPAAVPPTIAAAIRDATGASYALVGQWNHDQTRLNFVAADGFSPSQFRLLSTVDASAERFRMIRGGLEGRADVRVPPFEADDVPVEVVAAFELIALAGAPIVVDGKPWGAVVAGATANDPRIVETGADLLVGLASIAATALSRAEAVAALALQAEVLESSITERTRQLNDAILELRRASQAKTDLLANVSHELRTPLTAIIGYSELLLHGGDGALNEEQREDVETIDRSGRHLLELIDDLLEISRIETGDTDLGREPVDLAALIETSLADLRPLAGQKGIALDIDRLDLPPAFACDGSRIRAILLNLLSNAVKFTPAGGRVSVEAWVEDATVRIAVSDTGIGIAREEQPLVFDKFHRIGGPELPGNGLGLSIAREFARLHGGDVRLVSTLGLGSRFTVVLPLEDATRASASALSSPGA
jgi:two-component system sensor histidine kinase/response regulator